MPLMHSSDRRNCQPSAAASGKHAGAGLSPMSGGAALDPGLAKAAALDSQSLLEGRPRIAIRHRDETYWLHETRQGKLLLTK
jgi:hemin uptake protein HemP